MRCVCAMQLICDWLSATVGLCTAGANIGPGYQPHITSYDYDCPISEAGSTRQPGIGGDDKFTLIRDVIQKHTGLTPAPELPPPRTHAYGEVAQTSCVCLQCCSAAGIHYFSTVWASTRTCGITTAFCLVAWLHLPTTRRVSDQCLIAGASGWVAGGATRGVYIAGCAARSHPRRRDLRKCAGHHGSLWPEVR